MKLYATVTSERASKGQGGNEYLDISISGANENEIIALRFHPNGSKYELRGWTHDGHYVQMMIDENVEKVKRQKGEKCYNCKHGIHGHCTDMCDCNHCN